jgi:hypothetical protein
MMEEPYQALHNDSDSDPAPGHLRQHLVSPTATRTRRTTRIPRSVIYMVVFWWLAWVGSVILMINETRNHKVPLNLINLIVTEVINAVFHIGWTVIIAFSHWQKRAPPRHKATAGEAAPGAEVLAMRAPPGRESV